MVDGLRELNIIEGVVQPVGIEGDAQGAGHGFLFEVGHGGPMAQQVLGGQYHHVDAVHPKPGVEIVVAVLHEEGFEEMIVEGGVVVASQEEFVFPVVLVDVFRKQRHELAVDGLHGRVGLDLLAGDAAYLQGFFVNLGPGVGGDVEVEAFFRLPVDDDFAADLVDAVPPVFDTCGFQVEEEYFHPVADLNEFGFALSISLAGAKLVYDV